MMPGLLTNFIIFCFDSFILFESMCYGCIEIILVTVGNMLITVEVIVQECNDFHRGCSDVYKLYIRIGIIQGRF